MWTPSPHHRCCGLRFAWGSTFRRASGTRARRCGRKSCPCRLLHYQPRLPPRWSRRSSPRARRTTCTRLLSRCLHPRSSRHLRLHRRRRPLHSSPTPSRLMCAIEQCWSSSSCSHRSSCRRCHPPNASRFGPSWRSSKKRHSRYSACCRAHCVERPPSSGWRPRPQTRIYSGRSSGGLGRSISGGGAHPPPSAHTLYHVDTVHSRSGGHAHTRIYMAHGIAILVSRVSRVAPALSVLVVVVGSCGAARPPTPAAALPIYLHLSPHHNPHLHLRIDPRRARAAVKVYVLLYTFFKKKLLLGCKIYMPVLQSLAGAEPTRSRRRGARANACSGSGYAAAARLACAAFALTDTGSRPCVLRTLWCYATGAYCFQFTIYYFYDVYLLCVLCPFLRNAHALVRSST